jgi:hypothetical protein
MTQTNAAPARGGSAETGARCSLVATQNSSKNSPQAGRPQALNWPTNPIILASQMRMRADPLAEAIEFALTYGVAVLSAVREGDDDAIIASYRGFDAAARTARQCATELRDLVRERGQ